jgi:hypothetical protein
VAGLGNFQRILDIHPVVIDADLCVWPDQEIAEDQNKRAGSRKQKSLQITYPSEHLKWAFQVFHSPSGF